MTSEVGSFEPQTYPLQQLGDPSAHETDGTTTYRYKLDQEPAKTIQVIVLSHPYCVERVNESFTITNQTGDLLPALQAKTVLPLGSPDLIIQLFHAVDSKLSNASTRNIEPTKHATTDQKKKSFNTLRKLTSKAIRTLLFTSSQSSKKQLSSQYENTSSVDITDKWYCRLTTTGNEPTIHQLNTWLNDKNDNQVERHTVCLPSIEPASKDPIKFEEEQLKILIDGVLIKHVEKKPDFMTSTITTQENPSPSSPIHDKTPASPSHKKRTLSLQIFPQPKKKQYNTPPFLSTNTDLLSSRTGQNNLPFSSTHQSDEKSDNRQNIDGQTKNSRSQTQTTSKNKLMQSTSSKTDSAANQNQSTGHVIETNFSYFDFKKIVSATAGALLFSVIVETYFDYFMIEATTSLLLLTTLASLFVGAAIGYSLSLFFETQMSHADTSENTSAIQHVSSNS